MAAKFKAPRGTFDVLPSDSAARTRVYIAAAAAFERAGYGKIETPVFEETELFARGVGESTDIVQKEMFTFEDQGGRSLTLRPEATASICRAYAEHGMHKLPQPVKLWCWGPFFRHERPQSGRFRQFHQIDSEVIGTDSPLADAESIILLADLLDELRVPGVELRLGSLGSFETRKAYREELRSYLRESEASLSDDVRSRIDSNPLRAFDSDHPGTQEVMKSAPTMLDRLDPEDAEHFEAVKRALDDAGVEYVLDGTLVRGLDYYTRTVFEFTSDALGAQSGVGGGGRYDGLMQVIGGAPTPAMGWAAGIERILLASPPAPVAPPPLDLYVAYAGPQHGAEAFRLAADARRAGHSARLELGGRSLKGQLKQADRAGARYVAILGDEGTALKDMETGEQKTVETETVMHHIRGGL